MKNSGTLKIAIFDLDGTLVDTPSVSLRTWNTLLKEHATKTLG